ncbi:MAG: hypothetical protein WCF23_06755 [Candidatus Nitrosopolaris sp.]
MTGGDCLAKILNIENIRKFSIFTFIQFSLFYAANPIRIRPIFMSIIFHHYKKLIMRLHTLTIVGKIPGGWLVEIKNAGHALSVQYPTEVNRVLQTFLSSSTNLG